MNKNTGIIFTWLGKYLLKKDSFERNMRNKRFNIIMMMIKYTFFNTTRIIRSCFTTNKNVRTIKYIMVIMDQIISLLSKTYIHFAAKI